MSCVQCVGFFVLQGRAAVRKIAEPWNDGRNETMRYLARGRLDLLGASENAHSPSEVNYVFF